MKGLFRAGVVLVVFGGGTDPLGARHRYTLRVRMPFKSGDNTSKTGRDRSAAPVHLTALSPQNWLSRHPNELSLPGALCCFDNREEVDDVSPPICRWI